MNRAAKIFLGAIVALLVPVALSADPLIDAVEAGNERDVTRLLDSGADVNAEGDEGDSALHTAVWEGHTAIVQLLLARRANVNAKNEKGETPLHWAAEKGHFNIASLLLEKGAAVNAKDEDGQTPLHYAAEKGRAQVTALLLKKGADPRMTDDDGKTPRALAAAADFPAVVRIFDDPATAEAALRSSEPARPASVFTDIVEMRDGRRFERCKAAVTGDSVTVITEDGQTLVFPKSQVRAVRKGN